MPYTQNYIRVQWYRTREMFANVSDCWELLHGLALIETSNNNL